MQFTKIIPKERIKNKIDCRFILLSGNSAVGLAGKELKVKKKIKARLET
jgi:hypothetical protein